MRDTCSHRSQIPSLTWHAMAMSSSASSPGPSSQLTVLLDYAGQKTCVRARNVDGLPSAIESTLLRMLGIDVKVGLVCALIGTMLTVPSTDRLYCIHS